MSDLGRRIPTDWQHVQTYGIRTALPVTVEQVEDVLPLPYHLRRVYDQGQEGACVGYGTSWAKSILDRYGRGTFPRFDPNWLYRGAQLIDDWAETPPEEGTSVRAAMDILRDHGHRRVWRGKTLEPEHRWGIHTNRWATRVDEMRTAIAEGIPVVIGINWYSAFDHPEYIASSREWWIAPIGLTPLDRLRGGHCVCVYGASDRRQAFKIVNNWGMSYPLVWMPYDVMQQMLNEYGEAAIITDRVEGT